jgi:hypothetical protein
MSYKGCIGPREFAQAAKINMDSSAKEKLGAHLAHAIRACAVSLPMNPGAEWTAPSPIPSPPKGGEGAEGGRGGGSGVQSANAFGEFSPARDVLRISDFDC